MEAFETKPFSTTSPARGQIPSPGSPGNRKPKLLDLAVKGKVSASTQNQALSALLFLYRHVPGRQIGDLGDVIRARKPKRLPVVMTREEVKANRPGTPGP